jgi:type III secretion apparatus needle protein
MSGVNFSSIGGQLAKNTDSAGSSLTNRMNNNFDSSNPTHMMDVMRQMNNWSLAVNLESSVVKMIADTLKGVVQKIG